MENVKKFYDALANDEAIFNRAKTLNDKYEGKQPDEETAIADLIAFAKAEGYEFTVEEYRLYTEKFREITDDELEAVAGGICLNRPAPRRCTCILVGGGESSVKGKSCACIVVGSGSKDDDGGYIFIGDVSDAGGEFV